MIPRWVFFSAVCLLASRGHAGMVLFSDLGPGGSYTTSGAPVSPDTYSGFDFVATATATVSQIDIALLPIASLFPLPTDMAGIALQTDSEEFGLPAPGDVIDSSSVSGLPSPFNLSDCDLAGVCTALVTLMPHSSYSQTAGTEYWPVAYGSQFLVLLTAAALTGMLARRRKGANGIAVRTPRRRPADPSGGPRRGRCLTCVFAPAALLLAGGVVSNAYGSPLPAPYFLYQINGLPQTAGDSLPGSYVGTLCDNLGNCAASTGSAFYFNPQGNGTVSASGSAPSKSPDAVGGASVSLEYYFGVFGPFDGPVPLKITGNLTTSAAFLANDGVAQATATVRVFDGEFASDPYTNFEACQSVQGPDPDNYEAGSCGIDSDGEPPNPTLQFSYYLTVNPNPDLNSLGSILLTVGGFAYNGTFSANIDPTITFAPGFDSTGLTLEFSPGPADTTTPEPRSLALLGAALVLGLTWGRRRRTGQA